jgi:uncharacterized protein with PhoU and TrkA domain
MSTEQSLKELEVTEQDAKAAIELAKALDRLSNNRDFKKIIHEGYFKDEAVRLVLIKSEPNLQAEHIQKDIIKDIDAIGSFRMYLRNIQFQAQQARKALVDVEESRDALLSEESLED